MRKEVIEMPVKWTRPKKAEKRAEARRSDRGAAAMAALEAEERLMAYA